jgi:formylglycine-generating enzyme required for sulfatase activity
MPSTPRLHRLVALGLLCLPALAIPESRGGQSAARQAYRETIAGTLVAFDMAPVPGGTVTIDGEPVSVAPFFIGRTEVTWDMYDVFALGLDTPKGRGSADAVSRPSLPYGAPDYGWGHAGYPVISVTRAAAAAFCEWLSGKTGRTYRLPTEAEWLHAAALAAGERPLTHARLDALAWHRDNSSAQTHATGARKPDALGLFDLFGNAAEWVSGTRLVLRGGSFRDSADVVGPAARVLQDDSWNERDPQLPKSRWWLSDAPFAGFRLVRESVAITGRNR